MKTKRLMLSGFLVLSMSLLVALWKFSDDPPPASGNASLASASGHAGIRTAAKMPVVRADPQGGHQEMKAAIRDAEAISVTPAAAMDAAMEKIHDAATTYDPAQLAVIRPYLVSADPELRAAAVDAMIVLGDASAGAMLREAAARMSTDEEAKAMMEAADYVELPPANLKELVKRKRDGAQSEAPAGGNGK